MREEIKDKAIRMDYQTILDRLEYHTEQYSIAEYHAIAEMDPMEKRAALRIMDTQARHIEYWELVLSIHCQFYGIEES